MGYLDELGGIATRDVEVLVEKGRAYKDSWKMRGGVGAFMMLARKWDRIEAALDPTAEPGDQREAPIARYLGKPVPAWDIFAAIEMDQRIVDGFLDDVQDLRRYLMLVEAEIVARRKTQTQTIGNPPYVVNVTNQADQRGC